MDIKIKNISLLKPGSVVSLLQNYKYGPFYAYPYLSKEQLANIFLEDIYCLLDGSGNNRVYIAEKGKTIIGMIAVEELSWDTEFFGVRMARINHLIVKNSYKDSFSIKKILLNTVIEFCVEKGIKFLSSKTNIEDISSLHSLEEQGFRIMSTCATYLMEKKHLISSCDKNVNFLCNIRPYQKKDFTSLMTIANEGCLKSHFRRDCNISGNRTDNFYREWIKNSCHSLDDEVLVIENNNQIVGCAIFNMNKKFSKITSRKLGRTPLVVFCKSVHEKGAHNPFVLKLLLEYYFTKVDMVDVVIQIDNIKSVKYWLQMGARMVDCRHIFHKWF